MPAVSDGQIAYVDRITGDIRVMAADGSGDHLLWAFPGPLTPEPAFDLDWRPDGRELAFTSHHEEYCSYYQSDVYAIRYDSTGYRRVTNGPACAELAAFPKGSVTVNVANYTGSMVQVYVAGAPSLKTAFSDVMTFDNVADFGDKVLQPAVGIYGMYRVPAYPPFADVQQGKTVAGGNLTISQYSGMSTWGAGVLSWKADASALAFVMRTNSEVDQVPANPPYGFTGAGAALPLVKDGTPTLIAWGPTPSTRDQYLYVIPDSYFHEGIGGIYLNTLGDTSGGTMLVHEYSLDAQHTRDIEWLPDGSGFLFSFFHVELGYFVDIYEYNFAQEKLTKLTDLPPDVDLIHQLSISPDGKQIVFERVNDPFIDETSSLWIMNRDGSGLHKLADNAGRPAWSRTPQVPSQKKTYLPSVER